MSQPTQRSVLRIGNISGYYGDRLEAAKEVIAEGVDILTGDYLAELTMLILWKAKRRDSTGYAKTFLVQMEQVLGTCMDKGIRIVTNAGGLNPAGLSAEITILAEKLGLAPRIAHITGDDVVEHLPDWTDQGVELKHLDTGRSFSDIATPVVTANAYLGGWGIREALAAGADIVVCPRVTDAALVIGPSAWAFDWDRDDHDRLAGALVAGHVLECGAQATGGNYSFFRELPDFRRPGFPIAEIYPDGSSVITKPTGSGGSVTVDTIKAQLLYEIGGPAYENPDVVARFDSIQIEQQKADRVRLSGITGEPPSPHLKVAMNCFGGFRNEMTMVITGRDVEAKADFAMQALQSLWGETSFDSLESDLLKSAVADPQRNEEACSFMRVTVKDSDRKKAGRVFSDAFVQAALSSYPGFFLSKPPSDAEEYGVYWPALVPAELVREQVTLWDGRSIEIAPALRQSRAVSGSPVTAPPPDNHSTQETRRIALGRVFGTRSGDKGGNANLGVWSRSPQAYRWLNWYLTQQRLAALLPDLAGYRISRFEYPNLLALNFVVHGLLGEGVASSTRLDRQAKGLGEYLGCKIVDMPVEIAGPYLEESTDG